MSAIALGRMKAESVLPRLRQYGSDYGTASLLGQSVHWAIHKITGEPMPEVGVLKSGVMGWFLEPLTDEQP